MAPRRIALVSIFDGAGIARIGLDDLIRHIGHTAALQLSYAIEIDVTLSSATQRALGAEANPPVSPPHSILAQD
eukprot:12923961-Prorocentrum_lima.AAC.1